MDINFTPLNREVQFPVQKSKNFQIKDIHLSFYTKPSLDPMISSYGLISPNDIRLYINNLNVTDLLFEEIIFNLKKLNKEYLIQAYRKGAKNYLKFASHFEHDQAKLIKDKELLEKYYNNIDWINDISSIGERRFGGGSGNMHPFSFLYRYIKIDAVSLKNILTKIDVEFDSVFEDDSITLTFSTGPAPSQEEINPQVDITNGKLFVGITTEVINPLEKRVKQILSSVKVIARAIDTLRQEYLTPLYSLAKTNEQELKTSNKATKDTLEKINSNVSNIG
ncbi:hypothetical protein [Tenacibaculum sp.]|uniref:hypothetical protein n=1 Tax=Tenacibaculum sp. TaxID=1906242 RepID=UPI003AA8BC2A